MSQKSTDMEKSFTIKSLDKDLPSSQGALDFGKKQGIFIYAERWFYLFSGELQIPENKVSPPIYGTYAEDNDWIVSRNVKTLIDYIDKNGKVVYN